MNAAHTRLVKLTRAYLQHMDQYAAGEVTKGNILVSPPGVGKTSYISFVSHLLGLSLVTIEAPHIVEEKIINIPFLVSKPTTHTTQSGSTEVKVEPGTKGNEFDIELADSHLYTQLVQAPKLNDAQYLELIYKDHNISSFFESLGGSKTKIPELIQDIRSHYKVILFIDEFFRTPSPTIAAILRGLLNKRIGMHVIPKDVYVTYATNKSDVGDSISERQQNQRFNMFHMASPTKDEWFDWLINKFKSDHHGVTLNMKVIDHFKTILSDADISSDEELESGDIIRMSPRRWEQLILYINAAFPIKDENDAKSLLTNVKVNFLHYLEKTHHSLAAKVGQSVVKLIKDLSGLSVSSGDIHDEADWRETLKHQIEVKMKLGDARKYIPVVSGPPGIGKTASAITVAEELNLRLIHIDCSELTDAGEVIGMAAPDRQNGKISVKFAASKLYKQIHEQIKEEETKYYNSLVEEHSKEDGTKLFREYTQQRWKYLIFFDELNRAPQQVFNALRRIILEKNFGEKDGNGNVMELPRESIVMAAINPTGNGTHELTHHMRDVMDIIPGSASWKLLRPYLEKKSVRKVEPDVKEAVISAVEQIGSKFGIKSKGTDRQVFYIDAGDDEGIYISPNDLTDMIMSASRSVQTVMNDTLQGRHVTELSAAEIKQLDLDIKEAIFDAFESTYHDIFDNHNVDGSAWIQTFRSWLNHSTIAKELTSQKSKNVTSHENIGTILEKHLSGDATKSLKDDTAFINYLKSHDHVTAANNIEVWLKQLLSDETKAKRYLTEISAPEVKYDAVAEELNKTGNKVPPIFNLVTNVAVALTTNGFSGEVFFSLLSVIDEIFDNALSKLEKDKVIDSAQYNKLFQASADLIQEISSF